MPQRPGGRDCPSLAEALHVFWIIRQILGLAFHCAGEVAGELIARHLASWRLLAQGLFQALSYQPGFRHAPRLRLTIELG